MSEPAHSVNRFAKLYRDVFSAVAPEEALGIVECAERYRFLYNKGSYVGMWNRRVAPYLCEIMETLTSANYKSVVFLAPARCGKTDVIFNWILWAQRCCPMNFAVVHMTRDSASHWSKNDLARVIRDCPAFKETIRVGRNYKNVFDTYFRSGTALSILYPTASQLSGKTLQCVAITDYDRMPDNLEGEGTVYDLAYKRTQTAGRFAMTYVESSPSRDIISQNSDGRGAFELPPSGGIAELYNRGDRRRFYWPCCGCGEWFEPSFANLKWTAAEDIGVAAESVRMVCPYCQFAHSFEATEGGGCGRAELNRRGRWVGEGQTLLAGGELVGSRRKTPIASFMLKGAAAAFVDWKTLVFKWLEAHEVFKSNGNANPIKTTTNIDQGELYMPPAVRSRKSAEDLRAGAAAYARAVVPSWIRYLLAAVDVQGDRFEVQVCGFGVDGSITIVDRFAIRTSERDDPNKPGQKLPLEPAAYSEDWDTLTEQVLRRFYPLASDANKIMGIRAVACDSGGGSGTTANAYAYWRKLRDTEELYELWSRFQLVRGTGNINAPRVRLIFPDAQESGGFKAANARGEIPVLFINSNAIKTQAANLLSRMADSGARLIYGEWLPQWWFKEMTAEVLTEKGWQATKQKRNESWDLLCYCIALNAANMVEGEVIDWQAPPVWAAPLGENSLVVDKSDKGALFENRTKLGRLAKTYSIYR